MVLRIRNVYDYLLFQLHLWVKDSIRMYTSIIPEHFVRYKQMHMRFCDAQFSFDQFEEKCSSLLLFCFFMSFFFSRSLILSYSEMNQMRSSTCICVHYVKWQLAIVILSHILKDVSNVSRRFPLAHALENWDTYTQTNIENSNLPTLAQILFFFFASSFSI